MTIGAPESDAGVQLIGASTDASMDVSAPTSLNASSATSVDASAAVLSTVAATPVLLSVVAASGAQPIAIAHEVASKPHANSLLLYSSKSAFTFLCVETRREPVYIVRKRT